ncbi:hypothetical protein LAZ40_11715 [Cereibacter sphaeroides]|uniref:hypothetical protein n=1 Tax=Cereibacter sphaeroides TaxID=1063 RepID=UPI001F29D35A|nr:hypothetical protein [Cereibacter sphaeroides]MCE6959686.1 hypothetical protein [Cereibacter sphaeroides]MCE6974453.1 hypothetical protein [Cereibacter sphaeroides]
MKTLPAASEKTVEFLVGSAGEITLAMRPCLPFLSEGYRVVGRGQIHLFGEGRKIAVSLPEDIGPALAGADQILLCEFAAEGAEPVREVELSRA